MADATTTIKSIDDIQHVFYINLESRLDRKEHIEAQLKRVGFTTFERFNAIKMPNNSSNSSNSGRVGCSMSHIKCLEIAKERGYNHLFICEDDTLFTQPDLFKNQLNKFLMNKHSWDVVLFAGNNIPPYERIDESCVSVSRCQTTTAYLVNGTYFDKLISNMKEGVHKLMQEPDNHFHYSLDKYWFKLQLMDNWFLITPLTVVQREDYSDIENRRTNYSQMMVDLDKHSLFQTVQMATDRHIPSIGQLYMGL
jgi:GR25 family glycosyltransferase involved in LPS biosynthesis